SDECEGLVPGEPAGEPDQQNGYAEQVRAGLWKTVFAEVRNLLHSDQHGRKRFDVYWRVRIQSVPVLIKAVPEGSDGKQTEVRIDGEQIDHVTHFPEHD